MKAIAAVLLLFTVYFPVALWLESTNTEPFGPMQPLPIFGLAKSGLCVSRFWQPNEMTRVEVYEGNVSLGYAIKVYDDPGRIELSTSSRHWKLVEFTCPDPLPARTLHGLPAK
jgi:hypothetical protein